MPIEFRCTHCRKLLRTPDDTVGKQTKCPACKSLVPVPDPSAAGHGVALSETAPTPPRIRNIRERGLSAGTSGPAAPGLDPSRALSPAADAETGAPPDTFNPYQAPSGTGAGVGDTPGTGPQEFDRRRISAVEVLRTTWQIYKANPGACIMPLIASGASYLGVILFVGIMAGFVSETANLNEAAAYVVQMGFGFIMLTVMLWLFLGLASYNIALVRDRQPSLGMVFSGGEHMLPALGASVLLYIGVYAINFTFACLVGIAAEGLLETVGYSGATVAFFFGVQFLTHLGMLVFFGQYAFLIVDEYAGAIESLTRSVGIMRGNKLAYLSLLIVAVLLNLAGAALVGIGLIVTLPYVLLLLAVTYLSIAGKLRSSLPAARYDA